MKKAAHHFQKTASSAVPLRPVLRERLDTSALRQYADGWYLDGQIGRQSPKTLASRRMIVGRLLWFLEQRGANTCGADEMRAFLAHLATAHELPGGRWGMSASHPSTLRAPRPGTIQTYHRYLRSFAAWLIREGALDVSLLATITPPQSRADQIQPFSESQVQALFAAAKRSRHPRRDEAMVAFLLDTGVRAAELCGLRLADMDMMGKRCTVLGKGNKHRTVFFGRTTAKAIWSYLREEERSAETPLFLSDRGSRTGEALTCSGLFQLVKRLGKAARVDAVRCSPHTFRHTMALSFLRNGGNVFTLQQILGHTALAMTNKYVALAQADIESQHRQFSPVDRMKGS